MEYCTAHGGTNRIRPYSVKAITPEALSIERMLNNGRFLSESSDQLNVMVSRRDVRTQ
jgi:hypothetical protein